MTTTHPRRRFFRYSLRTLLLVVTVFCVFMGTLGTFVKRAMDQRLAVESIRESGGGISYESGSGGPNWLRQLIGNEYFSSVVLVRLTGPNVKNESLKFIKRLTDVETLDLTNTQITSACWPTGGRGSGSRRRRGDWSCTAPRSPSGAGGQGADRWERSFRVVSPRPQA